MAQRQISLVQDLETSYFAYAVEVITDRALPRIEDGLLPVQRRILYAMHAMGLRHTAAYKKSARVVGEVLGKFHPHGDSSVYGSMVRLAQEFSMRAPLVDGQGNFGSIDGDSPAAMRYTEARLPAIAQPLLQDLDRDTVDWVDNFDGSLKEPVILPAALPNLLVNGASGIAVGMSTNMPPHNLAEVCEALVYVAQNWAKREKITVDQLMEFIPGPDFPTGGIAYRYRTDGTETVDTIRDAYLAGRGKIVTQARLSVKEIGGGKASIIVTQLPYAVQKSTVLDKIAREVGAGRIEGVGDLRDESDYEGMRVVIEVMRGYDPHQTLDQLLTYTQLRETFGVISRVLVVDDEGQVRPEMLSLAQMLIHFINHRLNVIIRRTKHELAEREARLHIIEGLLKALDRVDEVVAAIRKSRSKQTARTNLRRTPFNFSQVQANAIVAMPLGNLASLEIKSLKTERRELNSRIKYLKGLLSSQARRLAVVVEETETLKEEFATPRRTVILDDEKQAAGSAAIATEADLRRPDKPQVAIISTAGFKRFDAPYRYRVGDGVTSRAVETNLAQLDAIDPGGDILLLSTTGRAWQGPVWRLPVEATAEQLGLKEGEQLLNLLRPGELTLGTRRGQVKRIEPELIEASWAQVIGLGKGDEVLFAGIGPEVIFVTTERVIRFAGEQVNPQATPSARGVIGIKVKKKDRVLAGAAFDPAHLSHLVTISENGFVKRIPLAEIPLQGRGGQGVVLGVTATTGPIVTAALAPPGGNLDIILARGRRHRLAILDVPELSRTRRGEPLPGFDDDDPPVRLVCLEGRR